MVSLVSLVSPVLLDRRLRSSERCPVHLFLKLLSELSTVDLWFLALGIRLG